MRNIRASRAAGLVAVALFSATLVAAADPPTDDGAVVVTPVEHDVELLEFQALAAALEAGEATFLTDAELAGIVGAGDLWKAHCLAVGTIVLGLTKNPLFAYSAYKGCMANRPAMLEQ